MAGTILPALAWFALSLSVPAPGPDLVLDGVIVAANPVDSVALVRRAEMKRAQALRVGQKLQGYVLLEVTREFARFRGDEGELRLFVAAAGDSTSPPKEGLSNDGGDSEWIRRAFPRAVARERLAKEIPVILSETDLAPRVEDGEVRGLRVSRLPDGTLLSESGLLPGDLLVSINGEPLSGIEGLWELIARLVDQEEIRVVVRRRGETLKLAYAFTN